MGLKKNIVYSSILTVSNYLFPFLTYPYISRVLGVTNIGICNFIDSIINYYILFSMMGMGTIAIRAIANNKNDDGKLSKTFSSLFLLNSISTIIVLCVLIASIYIVPTLYQYKEMMYIGAFKLIFNYLLIEWFYKGIENFKYITQRSIIVKCVYVVLVYLLIKERNDYIIYYALSTLIIVINAFLNLFHSRHFTRFTLKGISVIPYLKSFVILGIYSLLTSMYTSFNVAFLGFVAGEKEVGYYTTAVKLYTILLSLFTAFTGVMMPRMSALIANGERDEFMRLAKKSIETLLLFVMPVIVFSIAFAPQIIYIIAGPEYGKAVLPMRIVMPLMLIIGYEQIIIIQMLMPLKKDKAILINSMLGAFVGLLMNILLVPGLKSVGSAIVWIMAEITVLCSGQFFVTKYTKFEFPYLDILKKMVSALPIGILCYIISELNIPILIRLIIGFLLLSSYYFFIDFYILKNEILFSSLSYLKNRITKK